MATPPTTTSADGQSAAMKAAFYRETFLDHFYDKSPTLKDGVPTPLPMHEGLVVDWPRYHELALVESAGTEGTYGDTTEKPIEMMAITATLEVWYNTVGFSTLWLKTTRDKDPKSSIISLLGRNAGASMEWQVRKHIAQYGITGLRVDYVDQWNATFQKWDVPVGRNSTTNTTTAIYLPSLTHSEGFWNGAFLTVKRGKSEGYCGRITNWNASDDVATVSPAMPEAMDLDKTAFNASGNQTYVNICQPFRAATKSFHVDSSNLQIKSGDTLTIKALLKAATILDENGAETFEDGYYHCYVSAKTEHELKNDTNWLTMQQYTMRKGIEKGEVGIIAGFKLIKTTLPVTYDNPAAYVEGWHAIQTSAHSLQDTEVTLCMGRNAFGIVDLSGDEDSVYDPQVIFNTAIDTYNKHGLHGFATWVIHFVTKALNANYCVGIFSHRG